ncbi:hypothetical protein BgiBS90_019042, partial [Biomphalaria glabrata]
TKLQLDRANTMIVGPAKVTIINNYYLKDKDVIAAIDMESHQQSLECMDLVQRCSQIEVTNVKNVIMDSGTINVTNNVLIAVNDSLNQVQSQRAIGRGDCSCLKRFYGRAKSIADYIGDIF